MIPIVGSLSLVERLNDLRGCGVKKAEFDESGLRSVEFFPPESKPQVQAPTHTIPTDNEMPPDDVMLFASTPTFDEMVEAAKPKE